jgi:hypothetical protein
MIGEACAAIEICDVIARALPWHEIGTIVAASAFAYGLAMSVAFFLYVYRFRDQVIARRKAKVRRWSANAISELISPFGDIAGKLHMLRIECTRCARKDNAASPSSSSARPLRQQEQMGVRSSRRMPETASPSTARVMRPGCPEDDAFWLGAESILAQAHGADAQKDE